MSHWGLVGEQLHMTADWLGERGTPDHIVEQLAAIGEQVGRLADEDFPTDRSDEPEMKLGLSRDQALVLAKACRIASGTLVFDATDSRLLQNVNENLQHMVALTVAMEGNLDD